MDTTTKPKLILIAPLPPPFGGIANITQSLINAGLSRSIELIHIDTSKKTPTEHIGKVTPRDFYFAVKNFFRLLLVCLRNSDCRIAFLIGTCDTAIARDICFVLLLRSFGIEIVYNLHGTRKSARRNRLLWALTKCAMRQCVYILSPTRIDLEGLRESGIEESKIKLFYNSTYIPHECLDHEAISRRDSKSLNIVGIGRLSEAKGTFDLIEACIDLLDQGYDITLTWIGKGAYPSDDIKVQSLLSRKDVPIEKRRIQMMSSITDDQKFRVLKESDLFVLPTYADNLPIAILEAMAFGLPIVSTMVGAIPEVVESGRNGWLIEPGDGVALKDILTSIYQRRNVFDGVRQANARLFAEKFSAEIRVRELLQYLNQQENHREPLVTTEVSISNIREDQP